jgi:hypothetical protein
MTWDDVFAWCSAWWNADAALWVEHAFKTADWFLIVVFHPLSLLLLGYYCKDAHLWQHLFRYTPAKGVCRVWMCAVKRSKNPKIPYENRALPKSNNLLSNYSWIIHCGAQPQDLDILEAVSSSGWLKAMCHLGKCCPGKKTFLRLWLYVSSSLRCHTQIWIWICNIE